ncbi:fumarylacetoacetate hydrolase family protein [Bacterioplanoides sp. SCSIO 12839]|uniref:fumarylacetoacetate hydrolase family protein n=1 Tax=Bacterioplanoides sp. SCSIO 12839 TaxID=2829569 RepID=UPI0021058E0B|nr:fumarylacetoacetate hydrolase family protein [Bacterioplanoides sp. SCSIO 12839]UTW47578.1 fumarylacetoacetate hydrolase family protein [Bacterioplanoides sp. SCSIO 12839]
MSAVLSPVIDGQPSSLSFGKVVCVGRNYAEHAKELNNPIPSQPILFMKPTTSVVPMAQSLVIPQDQGSVHHELEIALLIGEPLTNAEASGCAQAIVGVGLALDLTLRDVQATLKEKGHPWERAKAFDGACPVSEFVGADQIQDWNNIPLQLTRNGDIQQQGNSAEMLFPILPLVAHISKVFSLQPGDLILTGTPAGVGPLESGDQLEAKLFSESLKSDALLQVATQVY